MAINYCSRCGKQFAERDDYCSKCGEERYESEDDYESSDIYDCSKCKGTGHSIGGIGSNNCSVCGGTGFVSL